MSFLSEEELKLLGCKALGTDVRISRYARLYNVEQMTIGNHVRIDDFCILSAGEAPFILEDYIHISAGVKIFGQYGFHMKSYSNISVDSRVFTQSDDFSGDAMIGPMAPVSHRKVYGAPLVIEKHVVIGAGSTILPCCTIGEGAAFGAHSLLKGVYEPWGIYAGSPAKHIKERSKKVLELELEDS
jgi:acetyltransferase-like isoleucine patch superfamily enzyme